MGRRHPRGLRAGATRRLSLTGTPFRSDTTPIPFVRYEMGEDGILRSASDYTYGYAAALRDGVVRPVLFLAYGGAMRWRTKAGDEVAARLGEPLTKDQTAQAWRTALDPKGEWMPSVLAAADKRLSEVRRHVPDAGGLVIAPNQTSARAYARLLRTITGEDPTVVLSDDAGASAGIEAFAAGTSRWMVAVRMVSEGVDVPRLCVGVYATSTSTPLFFAQAVGRFVRARRRGETASVFLPSVPVLLTLAADDGGGARPRARTGRRPTRPRPRCGPRRRGCSRRPTATRRPSGSRTPRSRRWSPTPTSTTCSSTPSSSACTPPWGREEEQDYLGLPGLLEPDQVTTLLQRAAGEADQGGGRARRRPRGIRALSGVRPPGPGRPAQGAQQARRGLLLEDGQPAREHPPRAAPGLRRARARGRHERAGARAGGADPALVRRASLTGSNRGAGVSCPCSEAPRNRHRTFTDSPVARRAPRRMPG